MILKEYYKMKNQRDKLKILAIILPAILLPILLVCLTVLVLVFQFNNRLHETTDINDYNNVIGEKAKGIYKEKWNMSEEIFPKEINGNVESFKMLCDNFLDQQFLSYLVVDYDEENYNKEISRLKEIGIEKYNYYGATGFTNYELVAMNSDKYYGFVYAITDGNSKIILSTGNPIDNF